ncbi:MAG: prepilin-type N-terminal cleavage/methylation domain-containing protein [Myxococcales bacterium]|nr:prepilin-type N-terminal cleavage/methylation domain-containing protein [Myxococcales bacterium]
MKPRRVRDASATCAGRSAQRGFTLVELMVALAISSIMVLMVLGMFARMSTAYRSQQQVTQLQVTLAAAQNLIEQDVKRAGFQLADGFWVANDFLGLPRAPVQIVNASDGPDELRLFAANPGQQARVLTMVAGDDRITVDDSSAFAAGELAVVVNTDISTDISVTQTTGAPANTKIPVTVACLVLLERVDPGEIRFDTNAPWGASNSPQCNLTAQRHGTDPAGAKDTMIYGLHARGYRIDPGRPALGVLQVSMSGALLANDWLDLGVGFTDLQLAARVFESTGIDTADPDDLAQYNWYSGDDMDNKTGAGFFAALDHPRVTQLTISLTARTDRDIDGIFSRFTPAFIDAGRPDNNDLGDHAAVDLQAGGLPVALQGNRIYRYSTNRIDLRNTGSGL